MRNFDLIVIGSGSGLDVANAVAQHGKKVAIIEKGKMGGTCLNRGCIPSKLLIHSADVMQTIKHSERFGIKVGKIAVNYRKIINRTNKIIDTDSSQIKKAFEKIGNPKLFSEECRFTSEKVIQVAGEKLTAEKFLIAPGTRPIIPKIEGLEKVDYITSDGALRLIKQPKRLTIIGGGFIAAELGHFFGSLGTEINIIQRGKVLVPDEDKDIATRFTEIFANEYNVYLDHEAKSVEKNSGKFYVNVEDRNTGKSSMIESDQLLIAVGRKPNSDLLQIEKTNVKTDKNGFIVVDKFLETNVKGIFALGDVVGRYQYKHNANLEAQYAFNNIIHNEMVPVDYSAMPHAIFSSPQIASAGLTEQELHNRDYSKSVYRYIDTAMGHAIEDNDGFVKLLVDKNDGKILGCHIIGTEASILIHEVLVAMKNKVDVRGITETVHIHPALSEAVARAASAIRR